MKIRDSGMLDEELWVRCSKNAFYASIGVVGIPGYGFRQFKNGFLSMIYLFLLTSY